MRKVLSFAVVLILTGAIPLLAQPVPETSTGPAPEPASAVFLTGLSTGDSETGPVFGGVVSKGLTSRLTLEGQGAWLDRGPGVNAVTAFGSLVVNLTDPAERVMPFVSVGGGVYHTSFDMGRTGLFGGFGWRDGPGMMGGGWYGPGAMFGTGPLPWPGHVPQFYARRLGPMDPPLDGHWQTRSFTDPMIAVGGGVRVDIGSRVFLKPDARALVIFGDGDTYTVGLLSVGLGVKF